MIREYTTIRELTGPLLRATAENVAWGELAELILPDRSVRRGRVTALAGDEVTVQLFDGAEGIGPAGSRLRFLGRGPRLGLSEDMLGRVFDGLGEPRDGGPAVLPELWRDIAVPAEAASLRALPEQSAHTGLSLDGSEPLLQGQCRALLGASTLGQEALKTLVTEAAPEGEESFVLVLAGLGLTPAALEDILQTLDRSGASERTVFFANLAGEPEAQRLVTPSLAMTAAEYFAYEKERPVLVLLWDMTAYGSARWALAAALGETPGPGGYPGALETELAALFERAGGRMGRKGSITLLPMVFDPAGESGPFGAILAAAAESATVLTAPAEDVSEEAEEEPETPASEEAEAPESGAEDALPEIAAPAETEE